MRAQWQQIGTFGSQINSVTFLDKEKHPEIGFVGTASGGVWRTSDFGKTWTKTTTPVTLVSIVTDFTFKDGKTGWLSCRFTTTTPGIYQTTDSGKSWVGLNFSGDQTGISYNKTSSTLVTTSWSNGNALSMNDGVTWTVNSAGNAKQNGISYSTPLSGIMSTFTNNFYTTVDGGLSWQVNPNTSESWQPLGVTGTNTFFIAAERQGQVLRSNDGGMTWNVTHQFPASEAISGDIRGSLSSLFLQGRDYFYISTDEGVTWRNYCGPGNAYDTRFYVVGDTVYAGTIDGSLWWNPFGTTKNDKLLDFTPTLYQFASAGCFTIDTFVHYVNKSTCTDVTITGIGILGSSTFSLINKPSIPHLAAALDSIRVRYSPDDLKDDSAQLIINYVIDGKAYEVKIDLKGKGLPGENIKQIPSQLDLLLASDCVQIDTSITIINGPCDSLTISQINLSDPTLFTITNPPTLPFTLKAGDKLTLKLRVNTTTPVNSVSQLTITVTSNGSSHPLNIPLKLVVLKSSEPQAKLSESAIKFDSVSICFSRRDTIRFTNTLCKPLVLSSVTIAPADPTLSILYMPALTRTLATGESDSIILLYAPTAIAPLASNLKLRFEFTQNNFRDTDIAITGRGRAFIDADIADAALAFDAILPCEQSELSTYLINHSCDSITITEIILPRDKGFIPIDPKVGDKISSGDSIKIRILESPVSDGAKFDAILIRVRTKSGAEKLLTLKLFGTVNPKVHLLSLPSILKLDSLAPCTPFDTIIHLQNLGACDTITLDSINLYGPSWFTLLGGPLLPHQLLPGETVDIVLQFKPGGSAVGTGGIHLKGVGIDTIIQLAVTAQRRGQPFTLSIPDSTFPAFLCKTSSRTFSISNAGCDVTTIDSLSLRGGNPQYAFYPPLQLPLKVTPGEVVTFTVTFDPSLPGDSTALLFIQSIGNNVTQTIRLSGSLAGAKQTARLDLMLSAGGKIASIRAGEFLKIKIFLRDAISVSRDLNKIQLDLSFFDNVLTVTNNFTAGGWVPKPSFGKGYFGLELSRNVVTPLSADELLAEITFYTTIGDSAYSPISLSDIKFNDGDSLYNSCVLAPLALAPLRIDINDTCGDAFIRGYIRKDTKIFDSLIIVPNPSNGGNTTIAFDLNQKNDVTLSLVNATGAAFNSRIYRDLDKGRHTLNLPNAKVAEGFYFVKLEAPGGSAVMKVVLIK